MTSTLHNYVRVEIIEPLKKTHGGIELPDKATPLPRWGKVLEIGPGVPDVTGDRLPLQVEPGDIVYFYAHAPIKCETDEGTTYFVQEGDLLLRIPAETEINPETILHNLQPLGNKCIVRILEQQESRSAGGIIIPETAKKKTPMAEVLAVGTGLRTISMAFNKVLRHNFLLSLHNELRNQLGEELDETTISRIVSIVRHLPELNTREMVPMLVKPGDVVLLIPGRETELRLDEIGVSEKLYLVMEGDILRIHARKD